jgi:hypothetical protein
LCRDQLQFQFHLSNLQFGILNIGLKLKLVQALCGRGEHDKKQGGVMSQSGKPEHGSESDRQTDVGIENNARRQFLLGIAAAALLAGCGEGETSSAYRRQSNWQLPPP